MNRIFEECIKESKPQPDFTGSDNYQVSFTLRCEVQDIQFLRFIEQIGSERLSTFITQDFLLLDLIHRERHIPESLRERIPYLLEQGIIERAGRGKYILSKRFYSFLGKKGVYTRKKGLDKETKKELLFKHIKENNREGSRLQELMQVLPSCSRSQIQSYLRELREEGRIYSVGITNAGRWHSGKASE